ncbi:MAG: DUF5672 family protein [Polynucleobacter sp.]|uniref:DUF5672 family protein n=1 Tax=Polynucleobacter sp. TaxID=2029855 RepID=UPI0027235671|nr:DUF5672 family protein [Polynucleobacter sp.]MDO8714676.1 DUF5672 family protein [Polynucleobacter sp.]
MNASYVTIIPAYQAKLTKNERYALLQLRRLKVENLTLVCPNHLNVTQYEVLLPNLQVERFDAVHFSSLAQYSHFVASPLFYQRFIDQYQWMFMHQLDAFLLDNKVQFFISLGYDYFGAPWKLGFENPLFLFNRPILKNFFSRFHVGNGGLSLRNIPRTLDLLLRKQNHASLNYFLEDAFFGYWGMRDYFYKSCPIEVASNFAFENDPEYWLLRSRQLPMGMHAYDVWSPDFYKPLIKSHHDLIDVDFPKLTSIISA